MNLEALKGTFKRAQVWIKKNPKKAAVAGIVLAVLIYFAIKQGSQSDGESLSGEAPTDASGLDSFGGGLAAGGDSSALSGGGGGILSGGGGGLSNESTPLSNITGGDMTSAGGFDSSSFGFNESFLPEFPASGFVNTSPALPSSSESIIKSSPAAAVGVGAIKPPKIIRDTSPAPSSAASVVGAGAIKPPKIIRDTSPVKPTGGVSGNATKTDAEKAGLPKYYTGVSGGKRYAFGKLTGTVTTTKPTQPRRY